MGERRKHISLWESIQDERAAEMNGSFKIGGENSYYQNMSPEFKYNHSLDNDRSHSHRYPGRGRSRSRSRSWSRTRGRSRSRSLSRGRERERARGGRGYIRSRSRSRSDDDARGVIRSRSPLGDYKHQSSGWSDRRSLREKSTEICNDFSSGRFRRGGEYKYFHPKNTSHRDGGLGGADTSESRRSRADYSRGPRTESRSDVSDPYHGEDEHFQNNSKSAVPCRNFVKGSCRWGDSCRFSHHVAFDETSVEGARHSSLDKDAKHQPYRNRNPLCKYFAAGKCDRDNCRFSHEDSQVNSLESRWDRDRVNNDRSSRDRGNRRNGLRWDDDGRISDDVKPSFRHSSVVTVADSTADNSNSRLDNRMSHSLGDENADWGLPQQTDNLVPIRTGNVGYDGDVGTTESASEKNMKTRFSLNAWPQNASPVSQIQQHNHGVVENDPVSSFHSNIIDDVKDSRNITDPVFLSGQNLHQNGENILPRHSPILEEAGSEEMSALNGTEMHQLATLDLQSHIQKLQNTIQMKGMPEMNTSLSFPSLATSEHLTALNGAEMHQQSPNQKLQNQNTIQMKGMSDTNTSLSFPTLATSEHSTQYTSSLLSTALQHVTNSVMFPNQRFESEHSGKNAVAEVSNSIGTMLSMENARNSNEHDNHMREGYKMPSLGGTGPNSVMFPNQRFENEDSGKNAVAEVSNSTGMMLSMENGRNSNEHDNHMGEGNKMPSIAGGGPNNSEIDHSGRSKVEQETASENPEFNELKGGIGEQSKGIQDSKHSETLDGQGKAEEANKDDKWMRLFKNSLVEFVKDILKPTWKEGRMSRDVHKTIVKKVVDKITSTLQTDQIPKTQEKAEQYLSFSKPKIAKLVQAYVDRCSKTDS